MYVREYEHFTLVRLLLATRRAAEAVPLLRRLLDAAQTGGREGSVIEAGLLLALAHDAAGGHVEALAALEDAVIRAQAEHHVRIFVDAGEPMARLLASAVRHQRGSEQTSTLLAMMSTPSATRPQGLVDELSRRELDVLRLLRSDLSGPEIATELIVSLNTVRTHTKIIFTKLGVTNRRAAVRRADELRL